MAGSVTLRRSRAGPPGFRGGPDWPHRIGIGSPPDRRANEPAVIAAEETYAMTDVAQLAKVAAPTLPEACREVLFGLPGGGSNLEVIGAAETAGIEFKLTHGISGRRQ